MSITHSHFTEYCKELPLDLNQDEPIYQKIFSTFDILCSHNKPIDLCCSFSECDYYTIKIDEKSIIPAYKEGDCTKCTK